jgi:phosphatidate cytidylyltransferase
VVWLIRYQRQVKIIYLNRYVFAFIGILILIPFWFGLGVLHVEQAYQFYLAKELGLSRPHILLFIICIVALADTSAYFIGKKWGKRQLASRISPGKTWEGLIGALITVGFFTPILANIFNIDKFNIIQLSILVFITVIASVLGDLFESFSKRLAGVKDSGTILPGHGGVFDRIDGYTAAVPIFMIGYFLL